MGAGTTVVATETEPGTEQHRRTGASLAVAAAGVALLPVLVVVCTRAGRDYLPTQDFAVLDLRVRDVWSTDIPLVGAYSRFGWNHPGPAMYWLIAPLSLLTGKAAWATLVGSALLQGVAIGFTARVAWKLGGLALALGALAVQALSYGATGPWILLQPWNPHAAFPYLVLFALLVWAVGLGEHQYLPGVALAGGFLLQSHIGYVPFVATGVLWMLGCALLDRRHASDARVSWRGPALWWTIAIVVVTWLPVGLQQVLRGTDGNLTRLTKYFVFNEGEGDAVGISRAAGLFAAEFRILPPWFGGSSPQASAYEALPVNQAWLLVPCLLVMAGVMAARYSGNRRALHAVVLSAVLCGTGFVALTRVRGEAATYLFYWRIPLAVMLVASVVAAVASAVPVSGRVRTAGVGALCVLVAWPSVALAAAVARAPRHEPFEATAQAIIDQLLARELPTRPFLVRYAGSNLLGLEGAIIDELDRQGAPVRVDKDRAFQFGDQRGAKPHEVTEEWFVSEESVPTSLLGAQPGARTIAETTPLTDAEEREIRELQVALADQLRAAGRADLVEGLGSSLAGFAIADVRGVEAEAVQRLATLNEQVERSGQCRCAVIVVPPRV